MAGLPHAKISGGLEAAGEAPSALLEVSALSKAFGATQALRNVSVAIREGEVHCLLGENGAGKSTLGKIVAGVMQPDKGRIFLRGQEVRFRNVADARRHGVSIVFQELSLANDLTVQENICLGTEPGGFPFRGTRARRELDDCRRLLAELDLDIDPTAAVGDLSPANRQLVEIAKAVYRRPQLLVLDEPTAMLGAVEKRKLFAAVNRLRRQGTAFVFITHHIEEVIEIGDTVSIMKDGELLDSFPNGPGLTADAIVEKLAGRKVEQLRKHRRIDRDAEAVLRIGGLPAASMEATELVVRRGEVVGLYGVVGCGRERIARAIVGLEPARDVRLYLRGVAFQPRSPAHAAQAGIAYLPAGRADNCILPTLSIRENLTLTQLRQFGRGGVVAASAERDAACTQLAWLRVKYDDEEAPIVALSGGNQQKVLIGRVMGMAKNLLVLEDPTAGIDVAAKHEIHHLIRGKAERDGLAVLLLSSDLLETLLVCDSLYTVFKGSLVRRYEPLNEAMYEDVLSDVLGGRAAGGVPAAGSPVGG